MERYNFLCEELEYMYTETRNEIQANINAFSELDEY
jgi:hypothetical protein